MSYNLPSAERVEALLRSIVGAVDELQAGVPALDRQRSRTFTIFDLLGRCADDEVGYPPSSGLSANGRGNGEYPNPVMALVTEGEPGSPQALFEALLTELEGAKLRVDMAVRNLRDARPVPQPRGGPPGCRSCMRLPKNWSPLYEKHEKDGLCRKCWEWWKAHDEKELPPIGVVEAWRDGRRLTNKIIRDAYAAEVARRKKGKKKGPRRQPVS